MRKMNLRKTILYVICMLMMVLCFTACGKGKTDDTSSENTEAQKSPEEYIYLIVDHDTQEESISLYSFSSGLEHYYEYGFSTRFKDKYGDLTTSAQFTPGRFVTIAPRDKDGYLTEVQLSDYVWEYEKIRRFHIDEEKGVFTIADTKYSIQKEVKIFSNGKEIEFSDISEDDILTVTGIDKRILSVVVTTGHGTLSLKNTELFENSFLQLGKDIFAWITPNMEIEVPEGEYTLKVANDGWGGKTQIEIVRGEKTEIDLETLKGEGKKKGLISFRIDVEEVEVSVDYQVIDHTQPIELTYGIHVLEIKADGYETWKKYLSVNSEEATLIIELTKEDTKEDNSTEDTSETESEKEDSEKENVEEESTEKDT